MTSDNTPTTGPALQPGAAAVDPDQVLAAFRDLHHRIRVENDTYLTRDDGTEDPSACAEHHDRLEALYAEAADTMATLDAHLATGGQLPAAWSDAHP
jgi:DNA-binding GntR family transcriptional regulator